MKLFRPTLTLLLALALLSAFLPRPKPRPTLFLIGDSTVKNGKGRGDGGLWGWGNFLPAYFDTTRIRLENHALGGTSSRTFRSQGHWAKVLPRLQAGDFVIMQFGHNDSSPINDTTRARGTIKSNGEETQDIVNLLTKQPETVHSYGWYLRQFMAEIKAQGATPIVCSPIPRNAWTGGKVNRSREDYGRWAQEAARQGGAGFIDLNQLAADKYDRAGEATVRATYFNPTDHTHTIEAGARLNAEAVAEGIRQAKHLALRKYLRK
ncbi:rhamnogalacturonan acetylesterase [Hymenobacter chitinivorans]|uniref:Lysophospholipase L1-like esterase n=1 Tax=Hymenobacter chitinivorans DSM 11115 TaxID=1121954 RepID=A0A2M9BPN7_9BACT|nr:rhamnogalacturonan acetylesterase [Hymenobacter chitinivorans]PJJ59916.1 lysophospholipase L1-like esterase [Hymenobacter chitinivorans DSM 11115]